MTYLLENTSLFLITLFLITPRQIPNDLLTVWTSQILSNRRQVRKMNQINSVTKRKWQKFFQEIYYWKVLKTILFFTCIPPDYVSHESSKEFLKNSHFENMIAGFLQRCQNSLGWNTEMMHFQAWFFFRQYYLCSSFWSN